MFFNSLSQTVSSFIILKIGFLIINALYIIFVFVVLSQIDSMDNIITEMNSAIIVKIAGVLNVIFAISLFLAALVIL